MKKVANINILPQNLIDKGFSISQIETGDLEQYLNIKRICYKDYVDVHFGGWVDEFQNNRNTDIFHDSFSDTCFKKILLNNIIVGFYAYVELEDRINEISIQMIPDAQNNGMGSLFLDSIISLSKEKIIPAYLKVFITNPAKKLYERYGFTVCEEELPYFHMIYIPKEAAKK